MGREGCGRETKRVQLMGREGRGRERERELLMGREGHARKIGRELLNEFFLLSRVVASHSKL